MSIIKRSDPKKKKNIMNYILFFFLVCLHNLSLLQVLETTNSDYLWKPLINFQANKN